MPEVTGPAIVFSVSYMGDLISAATTLDIIACSAAQAVTVVTAPGAAPLLARDTRVARVNVVRSSNAMFWRLEIWRELRRARGLGQRVVNLEVYPPRWRFIRTVAGRLGLTGPVLDLPALLDDNARAAAGQPTREPHRTCYYALAVGRPGQPSTPRLELGSDELLGVRGRLASLGLRSDRPLIVVHPGSSEPGRRPDAEHLAGILRAVTATRPVQVALVGVPSEARLTARLQALLAGHCVAVDVCGLLDLRGLMAALAKADLFVGGDSGPLKLAEAVGTPTLSFWAPGSPSFDFAGPLGERHAAFETRCAPEQATTAALRLLASK